MTISEGQNWTLIWLLEEKYKPIELKIHTKLDHSRLKTMAKQLLRTGRGGLGRIRIWYFFFHYFFVIFSFLCFLFFSFLFFSFLFFSLLPVFSLLFFLSFFSSIFLSFLSSFSFLFNFSFFSFL